MAAVVVADRVEAVRVVDDRVEAEEDFQGELSQAEASPVAGFLVEADAVIELPTGGISG